MTTCMACSFDAVELPRYTAAFKLVFGSETLVEVWDKCLERSSQCFQPSLNAYCMQCRKIRPVTSETDIMQALVQHEVLWSEWALLED